EGPTRTTLRIRAGSSTVGAVPPAPAPVRDPALPALTVMDDHLRAAACAPDHTPVDRRPQPPKAPDRAGTPPRSDGGRVPPCPSPDPDTPSPPASRCPPRRARPATSPSR